MEFGDGAEFAGLLRELNTESQLAVLRGMKRLAGAAEWNIEFLYMLRGMAMISSFAPKRSAERED